MSRRTVTALLIAAGCAGLAAVTYALAFHTGLGRRADASALHGFAQLQLTWASVVAQRVAHLCNPVPFALLGGAVAATALVVRGLRSALVVGAVLVIPNAVTQALKVALASPRTGVSAPFPVEAASWPSGHATAALALALCAVIAAPAGARALVAVGGALFAAAVAYSVVLLGWHFPSDVLGGFAVAGAGAGLGAGALAAAGPERAPGRGWLVLAALALAGLGAGLVRAALELPGLGARAAFLAGAGAIVAFGLLLAGAMAAGLSVPRPAATAAPRSRWQRATG